MICVQIANEKLQFREQAKSKVGSKDNIKHKPGGGDKKVSCHGKATPIDVLIVMCHTSVAEIYAIIDWVSGGDAATRTIHRITN